MLSDFSQAVTATPRYRSSLYLLAAVDLAILVLAVFVPLPTLLVAIVGITLFVSVGFLQSGYLYFLIAAGAFEGFVRFGAHYYVVRYSAEFVLAIIVCAGVFFRSERFALPPAKLLKPFALFVAWVIFRTVFALNIVVASKALVIVLASVVIYLLAYHLIDSRKVLERALVFQIFTSFAFVAMILAGDSIDGGARIRFLGSAPNAVGIYAFGTACIAALSFSFLRNRTLKILSLLQYLGLIYILLLTNSRASLLAFAVFFTAFLWFRGYRKLVIIGSASVAASIVFIIQFNILQDLGDYLYIVFRMSAGTTMRSELWVSGLKLIADYPFMGVGPGCIGEVFSNYVGLTNSKLMFAASGAVKSGMLHNGVLKTIAEYGFVGLALISWVFAASVKFLVGARKRPSGRESSVLWSFLVAFLLAIFAHGLFEDSMPYGLFILYFYPAIFVAGALRLIANQEMSGPNGSSRSNS